MAYQDGGNLVGTHYFVVFYNSFLRRTCRPSLVSCSTDAPSPISDFDSRVAESLKRYLDAPIISYVLYVVETPLLRKRTEKRSKSELLNLPERQKTTKPHQKRQLQCHTRGVD